MKFIDKLFKASIFAAGLAVLTIGKADAIPTGTITSPVNGGYTVGPLSMTGTCVPSAGTTISDVKLQLRRNSDTKYWKHSTKTWETSPANWIPANIAGNTWSVGTIYMPRHNQTPTELVDGNYLLTLEVTDSTGAHNATPYAKVYYNSYARPSIYDASAAPDSNGPSPYPYRDSWQGYYYIGDGNPPVGAAAPQLDYIMYCYHRPSDNKYWNFTTNVWQSAADWKNATIGSGPTAGQWFGEVAHDQAHGTFTVYLWIFDLDLHGYPGPGLTVTR